jgi:hypothetical protein
MKIINITTTVIHTCFTVFFYSNAIQKQYNMDPFDFLVNNRMFLRLGLFSPCFIVKNQCREKKIVFLTVSSRFTVIRDANTHNRVHESA